MIHYSVELLARAAIDQILVVTGGKDADRFEPLLSDGKAYGVCLRYVHQPHASGIADALGLARKFADGDAVCVVLGDNIFERSIRPTVERFRKQGDGARVLLAEVDHPESYGVAILDGDRVIRIDEKPKTATTRLAVTGCYLYDPAVFEIVDSLAPSARGEYEITDVN